MQVQFIDIQDPHIAEEIWALQHAAYAVEAQITGFHLIPPLLDTIETLRDSGETFYGIRAEGTLVAAIACETSEDDVTICRVMVHPAHHRQGFASLLLRHVEQQYGRASRFIVSTASANEPAIRLYRGKGFVPVKEWQPVPGLLLTEFVKVM